MKREEINKIADEAAKKAISDSKFKEALVKNANEAIKNEYNKDVPVKLTFHEFNDKKLVFVLPELADNGELGDDALNEVSGGVSFGELASKLNINQKIRAMGYAVFPKFRNNININDIFKK